MPRSSWKLAIKRLVRPLTMYGAGRMHYIVESTVREVFDHRVNEILDRVRETAVSALEMPNRVARANEVIDQIASEISEMRFADREIRCLLEQSHGESDAAGRTGA